MKVIDLLDEQKHSKLLSDYKNSSKYYNKPKTSQKTRKERLNRREVEELMNTHMDTYKRVKGRIKRK